MNETTNQQNLIDFQEFSINDKVRFNYDNKPRIGIVKGFSMNCLNEMVVEVLDVYSCEKRRIHPRNTVVDLRKF